MLLGVELVDFNPSFGDAPCSLDVESRAYTSRNLSSNEMLNERRFECCYSCNDTQLLRAFPFPNIIDMTLQTPSRHIQNLNPK